MPHQCTSCERVFPDGTKGILTGCPDCEGNTFQYLPDASVERREDGREGVHARDDQVTARDDYSTGRNDQAAARNDPAARDGQAAAADPDPGEEPDTDSSVPGTVGHVATTLMDFVSGKGGDEPASAADDAGRATDAVLFQGESTEDVAQSSARSDVVSRDELPADVADLVRTDRDGDGTIIGGKLTIGGTTVDLAAEGSELDVRKALAREAERADVAGESGRVEGSTDADGSATTAPDGSESTPDAPATPASAPGGPSGGGPAEPAEAKPDLDELKAKLNEQFEGIRVVEPGRYELNIKKLYEREETIIALKEDGRYVIDVPESWRGDDSAS